MDYRERNLAPPQERECLGAGRRPRPGTMGKTPYGSQVPAEVLAGKGPAVEPVMQAVPVPGAISGAEIVDDLTSRIAAQLSRHDALRQSDAYSGYAAKAQIEIQLLDVDTTPVTAQIAVGKIDSQRPVERIALSAQGQGSMEPDSSLERPIDPAGVSQLPPQGKRYAVRSGSSGRFTR